MKSLAALQALLATLLLVSSIALVEMQHRHRTLFVELQALERERDELETEWGRLQLEQSTWATHDRIQSLAREKLELRVPPVDGIVLVTP